MNSKDNQHRKYHHRGYEYTFTVFTPTYNRDRTIHCVYESLKIDDGSEDNTSELV